MSIPSLPKKTYPRPQNSANLSAVKHQILGLDNINFLKTKTGLKQYIYDIFQAYGFPYFTLAADEGYLDSLTKEDWKIAWENFEGITEEDYCRPTIFMPDRYGIIKDYFLPEVEPTDLIHIYNQLNNCEGFIDDADWGYTLYQGYAWPEFFEEEHIERGNGCYSTTSNNLYAMIGMIGN